MRQAWGWTQEQFGKALNTDQTAISAWERDKVRPSGTALVALAQLLGVGVEELERMDRVPKVASTNISLLPQDRLVFLPNPAPGHLLAVDVSAGESQDLADVQSAILRLIEWSRIGKKVWVVGE